MPQKGLSAILQLILFGELHQFMIDIVRISAMIQLLLQFEQLIGYRLK